jgi:hypothetical protein
MERTFILEYSQKQKAWHHNYGQNVPNTNGYNSVYNRCNNKLSWGFTDFLEKKHTKKYRDKLTIEDVRDEWELFALSNYELFN